MKILIVADLKARFNWITFLKRVKAYDFRFSFPENKSVKDIVDNPVTPERVRMLYKYMLNSYLTNKLDPNKVTKDLDLIAVDSTLMKKYNWGEKQAKKFGIKVIPLERLFYEMTKAYSRIVFLEDRVCGGAFTIFEKMVEKYISTLVFPYFKYSDIYNVEEVVHMNKNLLYHSSFYITKFKERCMDIMHFKPTILVLCKLSFGNLSKEEYDKIRLNFLYLLDKIPEGSTVVYHEEQEVLLDLLNLMKHFHKVPYQIHPNVKKHDQFQLLLPEGTLPIYCSSEKDLLSIAAAREVCALLNIDDNDFYEHLGTFSFGEDNHLFEYIFNNPSEVRKIIFGLDDNSNQKDKNTSDNNTNDY